MDIKKISHLGVAVESIEEQIICFADKFHSKSPERGVVSLESVRASIEKYGEDKLKAFDRLAEKFGY